VSFEGPWTPEAIIVSHMYFGNHASKIGSWDPSGIIFNKYKVNDLGEYCYVSIGTVGQRVS
jgi:hypothetical protein